MKIYTLTRKQFLPISIEEAWAFFSSPGNLARITPAHMKFKIQWMSGGERMYAGQIIRYKLFVVPGVPFFWTTEITHVNEPYFFVDEQRAGPYALWHHQHTFREVAGGVEMTDEVNYALPLGILGRFIHSLLVRRQLNSIFDYRFAVLQQLLNSQGMNIRKTG